MVLIAKWVQGQDENFLFGACENYEFIGRTQKTQTMLFQGLKAYIKEAL